MVTEIDKQPALVLIDLQKGTTSTIADERMQKVLENIVYLQEIFRKKIYLL
ncbi:MAG: hypothetical protein LUD02_07485 [Tannerellaceae bacterium]|nr:hypothetical protein [Tannerellaceae bacterium]